MWKEKKSDEDGVILRNGFYEMGFFSFTTTHHGSSLTSNSFRKNVNFCISFVGLFQNECLNFYK